MASYASTIRNLVANDGLGKLKKKSTAKVEIKALQNILKEIGYSKELNWDKYGADGDYGGGTTAAVTEFLKRNKLKGDGASLSKDAAKRMLRLFNIVDDLRYLQDALNDDDVDKIFYKGSKEKADIVALQTILNDLGWGEMLNWKRYGADGDYGSGTVKTVAAFGGKQGIETDGTKLPKALVEILVNKYKPSLGDDWFIDPDGPARKPEEMNKPLAAASGGGSAAASSGEGMAAIKNTVQGKYNVVTDGTATKKFKRFRKGGFTYGSEKMMDFIKNNKDLLAEYDITESAMNVMMAVSENEGNLDAINTWDNCFMTFGMFQWTLGPKHGSGELPSLLKKIKEAEPETFAEYYGKYGLDVSSDTGNVYGFVTLNGKKVNRAQVKNQFRGPKWSFIFWKGGHNKYIKAIEVEHALSRLKTFYWKMKINGFPIADIITSEYGVGLILDNHVNRPGYVKPCIRKAMQTTGLMNPKTWGDAEEMKVINAYIKIRATYGGSPMTHANKRAAVTKKYVNNGTISAARNSFKYSDIASRDASTIGVGKPMEFEQHEYPEIKGEFIDEYTEY